MEKEYVQSVQRIRTNTQYRGEKNVYLNYNEKIEKIK